MNWSFFLLFDASNKLLLQTLLPLCKLKFGGAEGVFASSLWFRNNRIDSEYFLSISREVFKKSKRWKSVPQIFSKADKGENKLILVSVWMQL